MATSRRARRTTKVVPLIPDVLPADLAARRRDIMLGMALVSLTGYPSAESEVETILEAAANADLSSIDTLADLMAASLGSNIARTVVDNIITMAARLVPFVKAREVESEDGLRRYRVDNGTVMVKVHTNGLFFEAENIPVVDASLVADLIANPVESVA